MNDSLAIEFSSWIISDGNYQDQEFKRNKDVSFALEFYSPTGLALSESYPGQTSSLRKIHSTLYQIEAKVIHVRDRDWWAIDAGVLMYRQERPPTGIEEGMWVGGEVSLGVDPFFYLERLSRHHTAPALIYDWTIEKIEIQTAPFVDGSEGLMVRDPAKFGWREIEEINPRIDGVASDYLLHCKRSSNPPRR